MKVLLIEPTKLYQQMIFEILGNINIDVDTVESGTAGLQRLQEQDYHFVLVSKNLPDINAIEFAKQAKQLNTLSYNRALVMLTADNIEASLEEARQVDYIDILPKNDFELLYNGLLRIVDQLRNRVAAKILYIEDSKSIAEMTIAIMTNMGLLIDHYVNGEQAIQAFYSNDYDLVITDVFVEGNLNGADIVNAIRKTETRKSRIPILAISGQNDIKMRLDVLNNGANDFISKPIQEDEFCARTNNLIALKRLFDQVDGQQKKLFEMAMTDQLTKLYNRHSLTEMAPKYISEGIRHNFDVSLLVIDLDHFKHVNDTYGHATGDIVLHQMGQLLKQLSRKEDFAARFGGEEFVMLLCHCHISHALEKAEMIRQKIEALKPAGLVITASIGVASTGQDKTMDFNKLFEKADKAVYDAKHSGRNQVQFSSSNKAA